MLPSTPEPARSRLCAAETRNDPGQLTGVAVERLLRG